MYFHALDTRGIIDTSDVREVLASQLVSKSVEAAHKQTQCLLSTLPL